MLCYMKIIPLINCNNQVINSVPIFQGKKGFLSINRRSRSQSKNVLLNLCVLLRKGCFILCSLQAYVILYTPSASTLENPGCLA